MRTKVARKRKLSGEKVHKFVFQTGIRCGGTGHQIVKDLIGVMPEGVDCRAKVECGERTGKKVVIVGVCKGVSADVFNRSIRRGLDFIRAVTGEI